MSPPTRPWTGSPYRRRRILWSLFLILATCCYLLYNKTPISSSPSPILSYLLSYLPSGSSSRGSSRVEAVSNALAGSRAPAREIDAFLHFVIAHPGSTLGETVEIEGKAVHVDFGERVDARVYSPDGDYDWEGHVKVLNEEAPVVIFSKTYCPFSKRAKALLESYDIMPAPRIIELDLRPDGDVLQGILARLTGRRTVPNILLMGDSIGGSDDIHAMHDEHKLHTLFTDAGLQVRGIL